MSLRPLAAALLFVTCACGGGLPDAVDVSASDACRHCRMAVSDVHFAAQVVARGEEPLFFDDIGCLANWLKDARPPEGAVVFVADHRTGRWVVTERAVFTRAPRLATPMGSGIIAHADGTSRDQDTAARGGTPQALEQVFGARLPISPDAH